MISEANLIRHKLRIDDDDDDGHVQCVHAFEIRMAAVLLAGRLHRAVAVDGRTASEIQQVHSLTL